MHGSVRTSIINIKIIDDDEIYGESVVNYNTIIIIHISTKQTDGQRDRQCARSEGAFKSSHYSATMFLCPINCVMEIDLWVVLGMCVGG